MTRFAAVASLVLCASPAARAVGGVENLAVQVRGANAEWTATPLQLAAGDVLICWASGTVKVDGQRPPSGPAGYPDGTGALQLRIGNDPVRLAGAKSVVQGHTGRVAFRVQDARYADNSGGFEVRVMRVPGEIIPAPAIVRDDPPARSASEPEAFDPHYLSQQVRLREGGVKACYERALRRSPSLGGKVVLHWKVEPAGATRDVEVASDGIGDPAVGSCIRAVISRWRLPPPPGGAVEVSVPFVFHPSS